MLINYDFNKILMQSSNNIHIIVKKWAPQVKIFQNGLNLEERRLYFSVGGEWACFGKMQFKKLFLFCPQLFLQCGKGVFRMAGYVFSVPLRSKDILVFSKGTLFRQGVQF